MRSHWILILKIWYNGAIRSERIETQSSLEGETAPMGLTLRLLGSPEVILDGEPATGFVSDKARAMLFYLAMEADRAQRRETLAGLLWPGYP